MLKRIFILSLVLQAALSMSAFAQGMPPANVVAEKVVSGQVAPTAQFIGTIYFSEISEVAAEVSGKVKSVDVLDGDQVKAGAPLVHLSSDILDKEIAAARANFDEAKTSYELSRLDSERINKLFASKSVAEGEYDSKRLNAMSMQKKMLASSATVKRLSLEKQKKVVRAPYDGIVLERKIFRGEWTSVGTTVATIARDDEYDVIVNVPARVIGAVKPGLEVEVQLADKVLPGKVYAVIPKGDVATRTFPVRIRVKKTAGLAQGMEAKVVLPSVGSSKTLIVPRDAVISARGTLSVVAVVDGKAAPMPVKVVGYKGFTTGVIAEGLKEGMLVVTKGNERLQPGQPVNVVDSKK
ncbi:MAG: efflux RND transporter periplasmic adaptor subunit [Desulfovibrio sp.]